MLQALKGLPLGCISKIGANVSDFEAVPRVAGQVRRVGAARNTDGAMEGETTQQMELGMSDIIGLFC